MKNDGRNCLYFYPTAYIDEAQRRGLAEHGDVMRRGKRFMIPFCAVMLIALVLIVGVWNRASTFRAAYAQTAVFLVCALGFNSVGGITFGIGGVSVTLSGLAIAALAGILLNAILPGNDYEFDSNPGTGEGTSLRV